MTSRRICFVTGTRAEFGLMRSVLSAVRDHPRLELQIVATGMHLDRSRGRTVDAISKEGWSVDRVVPWKSSGSESTAALARGTGLAVAGIARAVEELRSEVVMVVGDRVEAFAGATAGALSGRVVAHVHGGDRAAGQVDDSLRHAITKLAHVHFPATHGSAERLLRLGEDAWRIHRAGSPGIDGIRQSASSRTSLLTNFAGIQARRFALLVLHPVDSDEAVEYGRARMIAEAVQSTGFDRTVVVHPNNDPGSQGIVRAWNELAGDGHFVIRPDIPRGDFLGLMRDSAVLIGNSSSGIIEAASFGTPVIDVGPRQKGRERGENVVNVACSSRAIRGALRSIWNRGHPRRFAVKNLYGGSGTGKRIAAALANLRVNDRLMRKLIAY
jgi:GDP/UDP-N,N'-diacetylbacillosamine 2-epimerase (hydrolysing)